MHDAAINGSKEQKMGKIPIRPKVPRFLVNLRSSKQEAGARIQHIMQAKKSLAAFDKRFSSKDSFVRGMRYADRLRLSPQDHDKAWILANA